MIHALMKWTSGCAFYWTQISVLFARTILVTRYFRLFRIYDVILTLTLQVARLLIEMERIIKRKDENRIKEFVDRLPKVQN